MKQPIDAAGINELIDKAFKIRADLLKFSTRINMSHLGGEMSIIDMATALYYRYLNYDFSNPKWEDRDRFILSKGHCSEVLYMICADKGAYTVDYIVDHFECLDKSQFGQNSNRKYVPFIEVSAGSLGHGLPISVGYALGARKKEKNYRIFVLTGDGELDEGTNWEAMMAAAHYQLGNLTLIIDKNELSMTGFTKDVMNIDPLDEKLRAFGFDVLECDGNDMESVCRTLEKLPEPDYTVRRAPTAIIMHTTKGFGVDFMENNNKWHGGALAIEQLEEALASLDRKRAQIAEERGER
ncbi:MAG: transketolase [Coriobacteriales bacterium]